MQLLELFTYVALPAADRAKTNVRERSQCVHLIHSLLLQLSFCDVAPRNPRGGCRTCKSNWLTPALFAGTAHNIYLPKGFPKGARLTVFGRYVPNPSVQLQSWSVNWMRGKGDYLFHW